MGDHLWIKDDSKVLTSYPPRYAWECARCGAVATTEGGMPSTDGCAAHASLEKLRTMIGESGFTPAKRVQLENLVDDAELQLRLSEGRRKTERNNFEQVCKQRDRLNEQQKVLQAEVDELREKVGRMAETDSRWEAMRRDLENTIAERDECYMKLPVDADDVPIRPGDTLLIDPQSPTLYEVEAVGEDCVVLDGVLNGTFMRPSDGCRHAKPDPVAEELAKFLSACGDDDPHYYDEQIEEFAERIRKACNG